MTFGPTISLLWKEIRTWMTFCYDKRVVYPYGNYFIEAKLIAQIPISKACLNELCCPRIFRCSEVLQLHSASYETLFRNNFISKSRILSHSQEICRLNIGTHSVNVCLSQKGRGEKEAADYRLKDWFFLRQLRSYLVSVNYPNVSLMGPIQVQWNCSSRCHDNCATGT